MSESQSQFVHWQNLEYEAWYEVTGRKTEIVPGSFQARTDYQYENSIEKAQFDVAIADSREKRMER